MKSHLVPSLLLLLLIMQLSCKKDGGNASGDSVLVVNVIWNGHAVTQGVTVITDPYTQTVKTDAFGQAVFHDIPAGTYNVYGYIPKQGSGKTLALIEPGMNEITVNILYGVLIEPSVTIYSPENGQGFPLGDEITFIAQVSDNLSEGKDLTLQWISSIDGLLGTAIADSTGKVTFRTASLSPAEHDIRLTATNKFHISSTDSVRINTLAPRAVILTLQQEPGYQVTLNWTTARSDIDRFEIFRYSTDAMSPLLLATVNHQASSYLDTSVPFSDSVFYYIICYNTLQYYSISNTVSGTGAPCFNLTPRQVFFYPKTGLLYIHSGDQIVEVDYQAGNILESHAVMANIGDIWIDDNGFGDELYLPCHDGWLYIYDLATFQPKAQINVGVPVECVISDGNGLLYTSVSPSPWWEEPLRVFNRSTLFYIGGTGDFDDCRLRLLNSGHEIIEITRSVSPVDMDYYRFDDDGNVMEHHDDPYHGDHPLNANIFKVAPARDYLITSSSGALYQANSSMLYSGSLPGNNSNFADFEFSADASVIYAGLNNLQKVYEYEYPSLVKVNEWTTRGYPVYLFKDQHIMIVVSSPEPYTYYSVPDKIGIEWFTVD